MVNQVADRAMHNDSQDRWKEVTDFDSCPMVSPCSEGEVRPNNNKNNIKFRGYQNKEKLGWIPSFYPFVPEYNYDFFHPIEYLSDINNI